MQRNDDSDDRLDHTNERIHNGPMSNVFQDAECYDLCEQEVHDDDYEEVEEEDSHHQPSHTKKKKATTTSTTNTMDTHQRMKNIELRWKIDQSSTECDLEQDITSCSEPCEVCVGTGVSECRFCQGVGYVDFGLQLPGTMGEQLVRTNGGRTGTECPICNDDGEQVCNTCMGSGWIAKWRLMNKNNNASDVRP